jgi:hypothetical protein
MILTKELRAEIRRRREPAGMLDGKLVPGSVVFIRKMLSTVSDPHDRNDLLGELAGEYLRAGLDDEHLRVQRERVIEHPDAAIMWLGLAHSLSMRKDGADEAKQAVAKAAEISRQVGSLVRYALTCQAEVARKTHDAALFAQTLRELIADAHNFRDDDSGLDDSVLRDLPKGFCPPGLQDEYRQILRQYGSSEDDDSTPPIDPDRPS